MQAEDCAGYILQIKGVRSEQMRVGKEAQKVGHVASTPQNSRLVLQKLHMHQHLIILALLDSAYV